MTVLEKLNDLKEYLSSSKKMLGKSAKQITVAHVSLAIFFSCSTRDRL